MNDVPSYTPPFEVGAPLVGTAVGEVVMSSDDSLPVGSLVVHALGWREHALLRGQDARRIDSDELPSSYHLGILGMPGLTAYAGLFEVAGFAEGDALFVSGAAGAVGGLAGQFAKLRGASRVIGSAGSVDKVHYLRSKLGFDVAFNYHDGTVLQQLREAAPDGIDVYFDNVGGDHLAAALETLNLNGRVALCGAIASYNSTERPSIPGNMFKAIAQRLTLRGFISSDYEHLRDEFGSTVRGWLRSGELYYRETVVQGLDHAPTAFMGLLNGENTGKMVVRLASDPARIHTGRSGAANGV